MRNMMDRRRFLRTVGIGAASLLAAGCSGGTAPRLKPVRERPNILWIIAEDMSPNWSCLGERVIATPNIDRLAAEGVLFRNAFVTGPICSPSRSAMITGMYQTGIGAHNHRSSYPGSEVYLPKQMKLLPAIFKEHGYYTVNGGPKMTVYRNDPQAKNKKIAKTDYNFVWDAAVYDGNEWNGRSADQPFFAQIQLSGGKNRKAEVPNPVRPADVKLPPYYPDHPVLREDYAQYLNSVLYLDMEVGKILKRLDDEGIAENTSVILWTDHGISHARGKQFLYDEGIHIPLAMRWPGVIKPGTIREDLVSQIDISATSLYMAGIAVPDYMQGRPLLGPDYKPREYIFAGRDRADETLDCIRCVRTKRYKYIRNFYPERAHLQPNRYKDDKQIIKTMRALYAQGRLDAVQAGLFAANRPAEELYDLEKDPYEIKNLAALGEYQGTLKKLRKVLKDWMLDTGDLGLIPEPILEELARKYQSRYAILRQKENKTLLSDILRIVEIEPKDEGPVNSLPAAMTDERPAIRWWAARKLGNMGAKAGEAVPAAGLKDNSAGVRVECARALCKMGGEEKALPVLLNELKNSDQVVRHYAALALEDIGDKAYPALEAIKTARSDKYEYVMRLADRMVDVLQKGK